MRLTTAVIAAAAALAPPRGPVDRHHGAGRGGRDEPGAGVADREGVPAGPQRGQREGGAPVRPGGEHLPAPGAAVDDDRLVAKLRGQPDQRACDLHRADDDEHLLRQIASAANETVDALHTLPAARLQDGLARIAQRYARTAKLDVAAIRRAQLRRAAVER